MVILYFSGCGSRNEVGALSPKFRGRVGNTLFDDKLRVEDLSNWITNIYFLLALSLVILKGHFSPSALRYWYLRKHLVLSRYQDRRASMGKTCYLGKVTAEKGIDTPLRSRAGDS